MSSTRDIQLGETPIPSVPGGTGIVGFIRRRPLTAFLLWFFTVGQALAFAPVIGRANGVELNAQLFIVASTLFGLLLPTVVITRTVDGPDGVRALLRRSLAVRVSLRWYALALAGVPLLALTLAVAFLGMPTARLTASSVLSAVTFGLLAQTVVALIPNNWAEEVAWMGFVQSRLQERTGSAMRAAVLTGPLFALQHVSLVVGNPLPLAIAFMAFMVAVDIPFRAVLGWTYNRTGSLFFVGLVHAVSNATAGGSGFGSGALPRLYPGDELVGFMHTLAFALIGIVVIVVTRARLGLPTRRTPAVPAVHAS